MLIVCAWCNKDESGRVVCFRCGAFPAPADHVAPGGVHVVKACAPCAAGDTSTPTVSHGICAACETKFGGEHA